MIEMISWSYKERLLLVLLSDRRLGWDSGRKQGFDGCDFGKSNRESVTSRSRWQLKVDE